MAENKPKAARGPGRRWQPGQSGNPMSRQVPAEPKADPSRYAAVEEKPMSRLEARLARARAR